MNTGNQVIERLRSERQSKKIDNRAKAALVWNAMTKDQQTLVRFGMFPDEVMRDVEAEGILDTHEIVCGLMDCAQKNGGMRA